MNTTAPVVSVPSHRTPGMLVQREILDGLDVAINQACRQYVRHVVVAKVYADIFDKTGVSSDGPWRVLMGY